MSDFSADEIRVLKALASGLLNTSGSGGGGGAIADGAELDSKYGDPTIRKDPSAKYWTGASNAGMRLSECPADYLDAFVKWKDACAFMNDKKGDEAARKYAGYDRKDAARARGWAARVRAGYKAPERSNSPPPAGAPDYGAPPDYGSAGDGFGSGGSDDPPF